MSIENPNITRIEAALRDLLDQLLTELGGDLLATMQIVLSTIHSLIHCDDAANDDDGPVQSP